MLFYYENILRVNCKQFVSSNFENAKYSQTRSHFEIIVHDLHTLFIATIQCDFEHAKTNSIAYRSEMNRHTLRKREIEKINNSKPMNNALNEGDGLSNPSVRFHRPTLFICDDQIGRLPEYHDSKNVSAWFKELEINSFFQWHWMNEDSRIVS